MMMPLLGTFLFRERFFDLTVDQVAQFESIVLKETFANKEFMRQLERKLISIPQSGREASDC